MGLLHEDVLRIVNRLPFEIISQMKNEGIFLAGGFIRSIISGEPVNDIDLFGDSKAKLEGLSLQFAEQYKITTTDNAITISRYPRPAIQYITRWLYSDSFKLVESFDFTIARAAVYWEPESKNELGVSTPGHWCSTCDDRFYQDLAAKRLFYRNPVREEEVGGSLLRAVKFLRRGYSIQPASLADLYARIYHNIEHGKIEHGADVAQVVEGMLLEVDPGLVER